MTAPRTPATRAPLRPRLAIVAAPLAAAALLAAPAAAVDGAPAVRTDLDDLSPEQLAGQRVVYSYAGPVVPDALLRQIRRGEAAGVIFFGENVQGADVRAQIRRLARAARRSPVREPLLLMTDQEGGLVRRLPGAPHLSARQIGEASRSIARARAAGIGAGRNLAAAGMNVNLAPVLGVYRRPGDFLDQFGRSFGQNPFQVRALGAAFVRGIRRTGVAATAKHFPGLGAASAQQDTDAGPVTLDLPLRTLRSVDMVPYPAAIAAGVDLVMTSWAVYPALHPGRPAGLSRRVIQGELRGRLGFRGVTITDAIEAGALSAFGDPPARAVLAARAGADVIMFAGRDTGVAADGVSRLGDGLRDGTLDRPRFARAAERVLRLRAALGAGRAGRAG